MQIEDLGIGGFVLKQDPAYLKLGRRPAYLPEAVREWEAKQAVQTA